MTPKSVSLVGPRLLLREFVLEDWQTVHEYATDLEVFRFLDLQPNAEERSRGFVEKAITEAADHPRLQYKLAMVLRAENRLIGDCSLKIVDPKQRRAHLGYIINRSYWRHGYATEATRLIVEFGFRELGLHKICAGGEPANVASMRVLEKIGMTREGLLRSHVFRDGQWRDDALYGLLETDFR